MKNVFKKSLLPLVLLLSTFGFSQRPNGNAPLVGGVSTDTLNVGLNIPLVSKSGVGMPFDASLTYNSNFWSIAVYGDGTAAWTVPVGVGWSDAADASFFGRVTTEVGDFCGLTGHDTRQDGYTDGSGEYHMAIAFLSAAGGMVGTCQTYANISVPTTDGSGIIVNYHYASDSTVALPDGTVIDPHAGTIVDAHGNTISKSNYYSPMTYTDTRGTTPLFISGGGILGICASPSSTYTYPAGGSNIIMTNCSSHMLQSPGTCGIGQGGTSQFGPTATRLLDSITLADGSQYVFTYEPIGSGATTGRIASVQYPDGSSTSYTYGAGVSCAYPYYSTPPSVTKTTAEGTYTFTGLGSLTNSVVGPAPASNKTVYNFSNIENMIVTGPTRLVQVQRYQGGTLLETDAICYNGVGVGTPNTCATQAPPPSGTLVTQIDSYGTFVGASAATRTTQFLDGRSNTTETDVYTFGAATPSFKTFSYNFGYTWNGSTTSPSCTVLIGSGVMSKPCQIKQTDGSGNPLQNSYFAYNSKGDPTSVAVLLAGTYRTTTYTYNTNGTMINYTDPNTNVTGFTYGACNGSLLTKTTLPNTLHTQAGWDSGCWGVAVSATDLAGNTSTAAYVDPFYRLTQITDPLLNSTNIKYGYSPSTSESTLTWGSSTQDVFDQSNPSSLDSYHQVYDSTTSTWDTTQSGYMYDSSGIERYSTMPCKTSQGSGCSNGMTTTTHDALGRSLITIKWGSGSNVTNTYVVSTACTTGLSACFIKLSVISPTPSGETVKKTATETDGLGRLVAICAISSAQGGSCGFGGYSGVLSTVVYNSTGTVASFTKGLQVHSFTYDATGRMASSSTPEKGTTQLFYDSAPGTPGVACSTLSLPTNLSPIGKLVKAYDANHTTTCYSYDKIGRMIGVAYSGATFDGANKYLVYDSAVVNGVTAVGAGGKLAEAYTAPTINGTKITDEGFLYTTRGELSDVYQWSTNSGGWYHTTATYVADGTASSLTGIPGVAGFTFGQDGKGRINNISFGSTVIVAAATYNAANQPCAVTLGLGDVDTYTYDGVACSGLLTTGRVSQYDFSLGATPKHFTGSPVWNANGTLKSLTVVDGINAGADSEVCTYGNSSGVGYDEFVRLLGVQCWNGSTAVWGQDFTYDQYDNLSKAVPSGQTGIMWAPTYNSTNNRYSAATYDSNGNALTDSFNTYKWNQDNKVHEIGTGTYPVYIYDALGRRVEKQTSSTVSYQWLQSPVGMVALMKAQAVSQLRMPLPGGGHFVTGPNFEHADFLGNVPLLSSRNARTSLASRLFAPYGESYNATGNGGSLLFTGDEQDLVAGTYDTPNRELTPNSGRWSSPDPAGASWNAYAYSTNPMVETDPSGLGSICYGCVESRNGTLAGGGWRYALSGNGGVCYDGSCGRGAMSAIGEEYTGQPYVVAFTSVWAPSQYRQGGVLLPVGMKPTDGTVTATGYVGGEATPEKADETRGYNNPLAALVDFGPSAAAAVLMHNFFSGCSGGGVCLGQVFGPEVSGELEGGHWLTAFVNRLYERIGYLAQDGQEVDAMFEQAAQVERAANKLLGTGADLDTDAAAHAASNKIMNAGAYILDAPNSAKFAQQIRQANDLIDGLTIAP